jgi:hypothetical protein
MAEWDVMFRGVQEIAASVASIEEGIVETVDLARGNPRIFFHLAVVTSGGLVFPQHD